MKYYIVYKIVNNINGKIYIGVHQTKDINDGYMGSGTNIRRAIKKYGKENFTKYVIEIFDTPEKMFEMETILVSDEFLDSSKSYNINKGGLGSFDHINKNYWTEEKRSDIWKNIHSYTKEKRVESNKLIPLEIKKSNGKKMGDIYGGQNKLIEDEVSYRLKLIEDINMMEYGWVKKVSIILNLTHTQVRRFIKKHYKKDYYIRESSSIGRAHC